MPQPPSLPPKNLRQRRAFTLIELLVVIAIILMIAALLLPTMNFMRARADSAQCLAHLRQIGTGIAAFMNDHETFPGPLNTKQVATYDSNQSGSLAAMLESYLQTESSGTAGTNRISPIFLCPTASRNAQSKTITTYFMNMLLLPDSGQSVWGDIEKGQQPLSKTALGNWTDATSSGAQLNIPDMWAMQDADQDYLSVENAFFVTSTSNLLPHPAHDDHRNALFFDLHAERRMTLLHIKEATTGGTPSPAPAP